MNHPEHRDVIVFGDNVFEIDDIVEVKTKSDIEVIRGRISDIDTRTFLLDASKQYRSSRCRVEYADAIDIKAVSE